MPYRIAFLPKRPGEIILEDRIGVPDTLEAARSYAKSKATNLLTETVLIEITGPDGHSELWIWADDDWKRDDKAQRS